MIKEDFVKLGIDEALALKCETASQEELKAFIPKVKFDEVSEENKTLKQSVSDRDKQLEDLKKSSGDNAALQQQISDLQEQNSQQQKAHEKEMAKLKLDNAVELALSGAKAKNGKAVKALLDMSKVKLGSDGKLSGFDEQIEALKKSDGYMFDVNEQPHFRGFQPGASSDKIPGTNAMTLEQLRKLSPDERRVFSMEHPEEYRKLYDGGK